jgi:hypothetical protein
MIWDTDVERHRWEQVKAVDGGEGGFAERREVHAASCQTPRALACRQRSLAVKCAGGCNDKVGSGG